MESLAPVSAFVPADIPRYCPFSPALTLAWYIQAVSEVRLELTQLGRTLDVNQALFDKFAVLDDHGGGAAADSKRSPPLCVRARVHPRMCVSACACVSARVRRC